MDMGWLSFSFIVGITISIIVLALWRWRHTRFNRQIFASLALALFAFQALFFLQGSLELPNTESPIEHKVFAIIAIVLAFNSGVQLFKWGLIEFFANRRQVRLPRFLMDFLGWLAISALLLLLVREIFDVELTGILVTSTVATAIIGLSLQEVLGNLFAGIILQIESPFFTGDWVEVAGQEGKVVGQNWRTLALITRMNHHVIFTNSHVATERIVNYSRPTTVQRQQVLIGVAYKHSPDAVDEVLMEAIRGVEQVLPSPKPRVYLVEYGDSSINYRVTYWISEYEARLEIEDDVMRRFWYGLKRAGMGIPFPIRDVTMQMLPEDHQQREAIEQKRSITRVLRSLSFLEDLNNEQIERLAAGAKLHKYGKSEALVRQDEAGDSLFVIKSGHVGIYIKAEEGNPSTSCDGFTQSTTLSRGEFFGEMSLLTGEPRSASVIAEKETEVITIRKKEFAEVLMADPTILELLLGALDKRRNQTQEELAADQARLREARKERSALLKKITNFLGISNLNHSAAHYFN